MFIVQSGLHRFLIPVAETFGKVWFDIRKDNKLKINHNYDIIVAISACVLSGEIWLFTSDFTCPIYQIPYNNFQVPKKIFKLQF